MKKSLMLFSLFVSMLLVFGCVSEPKRNPNTEYFLTILHTNDHHGAVLAKDGLGGLAERATFINGVRAENENVLLLDAGDINTGSALSNMFDAEVDLMAYNLLAYDAVTLGNHEFDGTHDKLRNQIILADFPWLSANIEYRNKYFVEPYIIKNYDGFRVGIFGLTTNRTTVIASPNESLTFIDEIEAAENMVDVLKNKEKVDIVIALGHLGSVQESADHITSYAVINAVDGIDIFIDGHSHTYFEEPVLENGTLLVSANEWGKFVGQMDLVIKNGEIIAYDWEPVAITTEAFMPDAQMVSLIQPYIDHADSTLTDVVMIASEVFEAGNNLSRKQETALGDLVSDAQLKYITNLGIDIDFVLTNGGNIRASLPAGDVTRENILTMLPFENYVYVLTLNGSDVLALFDFIASIPQGAGGWPQISKGLTYTLVYDANGTGSISNVLIKGEPIDVSKTYKIGVNDYLAAGGDGYEVLTRATETFNTSMLMSDLVVDYAKTLPQPIAAVTDGRIIVIGGE
ncbi:MAG: 5'-nucleotidase C-terminal domain-containing protein [Spirochaetales bacterium]